MGSENPRRDSAADRISVHTELERQRFAEAFGVPFERITVAEHGESFVRRTSATKHEARTRLGLWRRTLAVYEGSVAKD